MSADFNVRRAGLADMSILIKLFDDSIAWMVTRGFTDQWGSAPFSASSRQVDRCRVWASQTFFVCEVDGRPVAAMVLGKSPDYVRPSVEAEAYILVLVGSHDAFGRGSGRHLLSVADDEARRLNLRKLRVDCFAGNDGALVRFYEGCGYRRSDTFEVAGWPGQVLERMLS